MTDRQRVIRLISDHLGRRDLYWAGLRSDDIDGLSDLPQMAGSFSIVGGHGRRAAIRSDDFEHLWGSRVDLDAWNIDDHLDHEAVIEFRNEMLRTLSKPSALVAYRPTRFLSSVAFSRRERCRYLGLFSEHQAAFDHKPWVESGLAELGVPHVSWTYVADEERRRVKRMVSEGPVMLRPSRTSGGVGLLMIEEPSDVDVGWPMQSDSYAGVAPYLARALPVNIGATVWADGGVTPSHPSVQLIGVPECTNKPFGYCGNDFGLASELDDCIVDSIESSTVAIGEWLYRHGYLGTFGVDYLVSDGVPLFTEVNPRFQGSTHASCQLSIEADSSCLILDHIAALLGAGRPNRPPLLELVRQQDQFSHVVVHSERAKRLVDSEMLADAFRRVPQHVRTDVLAHPSLPLEPGGVVARTTVRARVTGSGFDLLDPWSTTLAGWSDLAREGEL